MKLSTIRQLCEKRSSGKELPHEPGKIGPWSGLVYHGGKLIEKFLPGEMIWFSTDKNVAGVNTTEAWKWYNAMVYRDPEDTYPIERAKVKLSRAFIVDAKGESFFYIPAPKQLVDAGVTNPFSDTDMIAQYAQENGYDGAVIQNVLEGRGAGSIADTVVVFDKSSFTVVKRPKKRAVKK